MDFLLSSLRLAVYVQAVARFFHGPETASVRCERGVVPTRIGPAVLADFIPAGALYGLAGGVQVIAQDGCLLSMFGLCGFPRRPRAGRFGRVPPGALQVGQNRAMVSTASGQMPNRYFRSTSRRSSSAERPGGFLTGRIRHPVPASSPHFSAGKCSAVALKESAYSIAAEI